MAPNAIGTRFTGALMPQRTDEQHPYCPCYGTSAAKVKQPLKMNLEAFAVGAAGTPYKMLYA